MDTPFTHETGRENNLRRHPVAAFALVTLIIGWLLTLLALYVPPIAPVIALAPLIGVLVIEPTALRRVLQLPNGVQWYIALLIPLPAALLIVVFGPANGIYIPRYPFAWLTVITAITVFFCAAAERIVWKRHTNIVAAALTLVTFLPLFFVAPRQIKPGTFWESPLLVVAAVIVFSALWNRFQIFPAGALSDNRIRRVLRTVWRVLIAAPLAIGAWLIATAIFHTGEIRTFPAPAALVSVGDHSLYINCIGDQREGSPTIVLEAGLTGVSPLWHWVQQDMAKTHRVCSYDRAGHGWSEPGASPRTIQAVITDLHTLLQNEQSPFVLAGHSYGGPVITNYAAAYPDDVAGLVIMDGTPLTPITDREIWEQFQANGGSGMDLIRVMEWFGFYSYLAENLFSSYPLELADIMTGIVPNDQSIEVAKNERINTMQFGVEPLPHVGDIPLLVLPSGYGSSPEQLAQMAAANPYVSKSSNSTLVFVEGADHGSILSEPEFAAEVAEGIRRVIASAQTGAPLAE